MTAFSIGAREELRFETARKSPAEQGEEVGAGVRRRDVLRVVRGLAEIGGRELCVGEYPLLPDRSYGVFSWLGCEVEVDESFCRDVYTSEETQMVQVAKVHNNLDMMRSESNGNGSEGPRIALVGPANCGKSTLAQTFASYSVRQGRRPIYVDLDMSKNTIGVPGTVGATVLSAPEDMFTETGDLGFSARSPLLFFTGVENVADNNARVKEQIKLLSEGISARVKNSAHEKSSGVIIDTFAWTPNTTVQNTLVTALKDLRVNVILVVGHDRLLAAMKSAFKSSEDVRAIIKIPRSGGVPEQDGNASKRLASESSRWYFEGPRWGLSPESITIKLAQDFDIYSTRQVALADASLRPIGMSAKKDDEKVSKMKTLDKNMEHCILAVSSAKEEKDVLTSSVLGFLHVVQVDLANETIIALSPCSGELPSRFLIYGKVKYFLSV